MKTTSYNPSPLEVEFANTLESLKEIISEKLTDSNIESIERQIEMDNPTLLFHVRDNDGDPHVLVLKLIQKPDNLI